MTQVTTKLTEEQIEKIEEKNMTVYKFLQLAVEEKLINDEKKVEPQEDTSNVLFEIVKSLNERLAEISLELKNIDSEVAKNNTIAKEKLQIIADALQGN